MIANNVTAYVVTRDRYDTLSHALLSIVCQKIVPARLIIFDDGEHKDIRGIPVYGHIFSMLQERNIKWEVVFAPHAGQVWSHRKALEMANTEFLWRVDDDNYAEADVLGLLLQAINKSPDIAAVGGLSLVPGTTVTGNFSGNITDIFNEPNMQWKREWSAGQDLEVDHLHNTFLYRRTAGNFPACMLELSRVGHREETIFTYDMKKRGHRLCVVPKALTWHLRAPHGGIRSESSSEMYAADEKLFINWLGGKEPKKLIVLDNGIGDHYAFKQILGDVKAKYGPLKIACCYPEVFWDDDSELVSIAYVKSLNVDLDAHNVYKYMWDRQWSRPLVDAFKEMYKL